MLTSFNNRGRFTLTRGCQHLPSSPSPPVFPRRHHSLSFLFFSFCLFLTFFLSHLLSPPSVSIFHYRLWPCLCETLLICVDREDWSTDPVSEHFIIPLWPLDLSECMQQQGLLGNDKHLITLLYTIISKGDHFQTKTQFGSRDKAVTCIYIHIRWNWVYNTILIIDWLLWWKNLKNTVIQKQHFCEMIPV